MKLSRTLLPAALAGALLLTGCTAGGSPTADASGADCLAPGAASDSIKVSGTAGEDLKLDTKTPIKASEMQRTVLVEGSGDVPKEGQSIGVTMALFSGSDGTDLGQGPEIPIPVAKDPFPWAYEAMRCAVPGQQVAVVVPYADMFGDVAPEDLGAPGMTAETPVVAVMEFGEVSETEEAPQAQGLPEDLLQKAEGKAVAAPEGFPEVKLDKDGAPTITIPEGVDAPTKLSVATVIEGEGETVKPGDTVYVNYRGVIWRTGEEFDSSWSRGEPAAFPTDGVIGGFQKALEGQKVGSQIISVVPAEDGGYGAAGLEQQGHKPDDTMVFVLDILGIADAQ